ncbi:MAG: HAD family hydrolase [Candidatus Manganitrophaceae bacterium]
MKQYQAILFDLCDTLMAFRSDRMPLAKIRGEEIRTTSPLLYQCFLQHADPIPYETFHDDFVETTESVRLLRAQLGEEISSAIRFAQFLDRLGINRGDRWNLLHRNLIETHLARIALCLDFSPEHRDLLNRLKGRYRIGLVSNFDDTDTVYQVLKREGIDPLFDAIIISSEIGIRKPRREIFLAASEKIGVSPAETLFIGDSFENDVIGAKRVGMDAAWINPAGLPVPSQEPHPDYLLSGLTELSKYV